MNRQQRRAEQKPPARGNPSRAESLFAEATRHHQAGRLSEAVPRYASGLRQQPGFAEMHNNLGSALQDLGRLDEAIASLRRAIALKPAFPEAHYNLGTALWRAGQASEAVARFRAALALKPDFPQAHSNLGNALREQGQLDDAVACCRAALALRPAYPDAYLNLGTALRDQHDFEQAESCFRAAVDLNPDFFEAHNNLGTALRDRGLLDEAIACYRVALKIRPDFSDAHFNLGLALLSRGDFAAGFQEYEWRFQTPQMAKSRRDFPSIPQWRGEPAAGKTLFIHAEQGFGDTIQFCRYATLAVARGLRVILEVQKPLVRLLENSLPGVERVIAQGDFLGETKIDFHCPMLSLPLAFATTRETIPAGEKNYLRADPAKAAAWNARLPGVPKKRVGLAWAGSGAMAVDRRSMSPDLLAPLFEVPGLIFVSLQKNGPPAPETFPLIDVMADMKNFADTAALITTLDLVISVDTAVAHLAAALGKAVWLMNCFSPCWRWLPGRGENPWYRTLRLYRQKRPGDWKSVVAEIATDLKNLAA